MVIDTLKLGDVDGLLSATLKESAEGESTLTLEFAGRGPEWLGWEVPVTLVHKGQALFHGLSLAPTRSNRGGVERTTLTVPNCMRVLNDTPIGLQIADLETALANQRKADLRQGAQNAVTSWSKLASSCRVVAPNWGCKLSAAGEWEPNAGCIVSLDTSRASDYSMIPNIAKNGKISTQQALNKMRACNPDALFRARPSGSVEIIAMSKADRVSYNMRDVLSAEGVRARYELQIAGVVVVVTWANAELNSYGCLKSSQPTGVNAAASRVKLYSCACQTRSQASKQRRHIEKNLSAYYNAVRELQWEGTVTLPLELPDASPLAHRLSLTGAAPEEWTAMGAVVSAVDWDFKARTVTLTLGMSMGAPEVHELSFDETAWDDDGGEEDPTDGDGGDKDKDKTESTQSTAGAIPPWSGGCMEDCEGNFKKIQVFANQVHEWILYLHGQIGCCNGPGAGAPHPTDPPDSPSLDLGLKDNEQGGAK